MICYLKWERVIKTNFFKKTRMTIKKHCRKREYSFWSWYVLNIGENSWKPISKIFDNCDFLATENLFFRIHSSFVCMINNFYYNWRKWCHSFLRIFFVAMNPVYLFLAVMSALIMIKIQWIISFKMRTEYKTFCYWKLQMTSRVEWGGFLRPFTLIYGIFRCM